MVAVALYLRTLAPGLLDGDAGEFQFAAWRLGLAHPTGYPFYMLLGSAWQHGLAALGADPAWALNLFSGVTAGAAVGLFCWLLCWLLPGSGWLTRGGALLGAGMLAVNPTFWSQALIAEVYTLHGLLTVLIFLAALAWDATPRRTLLLAGLLGLGLAHHRTTLFLLPGVLLTLWLRDRAALGRGQVWTLAAVGLALPQLLYLYIPLRGTPDASPWYFPRLGAETINLYVNSLQGFWDFFTGKVFAISFFGLDQALARLPEAGRLWLDHFTWAGIGLLLLGLFALVRDRRWAILALTLPLLLSLQIFNLFYGIGDIYVYYIPLYTVGILYAAWAGVRIGQALPLPAWGRMGILLALFALPGVQLFHFFPLVDQSTNRQAREMWQAILAAQPPADAILISNDRNEIAPLYYLQHVEGIRPDLTGIFPLLTPEARFGDVGSTTATALDARPGRPVVLIKPMPGLEVRFDLLPLADPLVAVVGPAAQAAPRIPVDRPLGPLTLLGYDWTAKGVEGSASIEVALHWRVDAPVAEDYSATVQIFNRAGEKVAQADHQPGGIFYPTGLWKQGEVLLDRYELAWTEGWEPEILLVGMYTGPDVRPLAPFLEIRVPGHSASE